MKKILMMLALASACFGVRLKVTEIVEDLNLYIFEKKYVIKTDRPLYGIHKGDRLDISTDYFFNEDYWIQNITVTQKRVVGQTEDLVYDELLDVYTTVYTDIYDYVDYTDTYTFTPLGLIFDKKPMKLDDFKNFVATRRNMQPLSVFTSVYSDINWFYTNKDPDQVVFPPSSTGEFVSMNWLIDTYEGYENGYKCRIYPIYDRNDKSLLSGVLNLARKRKVFLHDHIYSLATFEYANVIY